MKFVSTAFLNGRHKSAIIYVMTCDRFVKVGYTTDIDGRLFSIQQNNPHDVRLVSFRSVPYHCARVVEALAHAALAEHRHRGEWFVCSPEVAKGAVAKAAKQVPRLDAAARRAWNDALVHSASSENEADEKNELLQVAMV